MKRFFVTAVLALTVSLSIKAQPYHGKQTSKIYAVADWEQVQANPSLAAADYQPYPVTDENPASIPQLTKAPKGYKPFYISHYGRHGSRWLISTKTYTEPVFFLQKANEADMLTPLGKDVLERIRKVELAVRGRYGELTRLGAQQHRQIAGRMYKNFPAVFKSDVEIDAKSTVIIRCILSMDAACQRLKELNPKLRISNDASSHDMYYMNYQDTDKFFSKITSDPKNTEILREFRSKVLKPQRLSALLLKDSSFYQTFSQKFAYKDNPDGIRAYNANNLLYDLVEIAINLPNTDMDIRLDDIVTLEEIYSVNVLRNASSYRYAGFSDMGQKITPYRQSNLLKNIIETADKAMEKVGTDGRKSAGATLRYGHDSNLMPLCSLMDIDGAGVYEQNLDNLANVWNVEHYIPKAGNLQFIFYGKKGAPVLVKVLLNEHEATLPVETDNFPYYEWNKVREFYLNLLNNSPLKEKFGN